MRRPEIGRRRRRREENGFLGVEESGFGVMSERKRERERERERRDPERTSGLRIIWST
uniref:Uncharacterized protein n=1 Tax=Cucumis melo TaxID=3656 RepID=A0A9I9CMV0_CUCME